MLSFQQVELERQLHDQSKRMNALEQTNEQLAGQLRECIAQRDHFSLECQRMQRYIESQQTIAYPQSQEVWSRPRPNFQGFNEKTLYYRPYLWQLQQAEAVQISPLCRGRTMEAGLFINRLLCDWPY